MDSMVTTGLALHEMLALCARSILHFDDVDGYVIKSEGVPEQEIVFQENK